MVRERGVEEEEEGDCFAVLNYITKYTKVKMLVIFSLFFLAIRKTPRRGCTFEISSTRKCCQVRNLAGRRHL